MLGAEPAAPPPAPPEPEERPSHGATLGVVALVGAGLLFWMLRQPGPIKNPTRLERKLERDERRRLRRVEGECLKATACYEDKPDRAGRRRRCRTSFKNKREAIDALDEALDGLLYRYIDQADDGSEVLRDLEEHTEDRRGRRRRLGTWWDAARWAAPSSRKWADFDPDRLALISDALSEHLGGTVPLELPRRTRRLKDADDAALSCKDATAEGRKHLAAEVPF